MLEHLIVQYPYLVAFKSHHFQKPLASSDLITAIIISIRKMVSGPLMFFLKHV